MSAFFSGSETALTAASRSRMHQLAKSGNRGAKSVNKLRSMPERLITTLLLGNTLINILASALATHFLTKAFGEAGVLYATGVMTFFILIFAEVLPKVYAFNHADRTAMFLSPLVSFFNLIFAPATKTVQYIVRMILVAFGSSPKNIGHSVSDEELRGAIELHDGGDRDDTHEKEMLRSILDLDEMNVKEIMIHRKNVEMIDADQPIQKIVEQVLRSSFTRIPLWQKKHSNIVGILHAKDLLRTIQFHEGDLNRINILTVTTAPWFIPDRTNLLDQLLEFKQRKEHFAVVVDEYGDFEGVVTLEDILEEIVGQIDDEHDLSQAKVRTLEDGSYIISGDVFIRDLNREYGWDLPDENASTLAGLLLHESEKIPDVGQIFRFYDFQFQILRRHRHQLTLVRVTPPSKKEAAA